MEVSIPLGTLDELHFFLLKDSLGLPLIILYYYLLSLQLGGVPYGGRKKSPRTHL